MCPTGPGQAIAGELKELGSCAQAKRKYQEVCQEKQNLEADRAELQSKYQQKSQQHRNLQARAGIMLRALDHCSAAQM